MIEAIEAGISVGSIDLKLICLSFLTRFCKA